MFADDSRSVYSHCAISEIPALVHQLSSCIDDLAKSDAMLPTASTQPGEDRVHLVRFTRQLDQNTTALSINSSLWVKLTREPNQMKSVFAGLS